MSRFLIQAVHTPDECLRALDEVLGQGPDSLDRYDFACAAGDHSNHTCFTAIEAADETAARMTIPSFMRDRAQVIEVGKYTPEQIRSFHQGN